MNNEIIDSVLVNSVTYNVINYAVHFTCVGLMLVTAKNLYTYLKLSANLGRERMIARHNLLGSVTWLILIGAAVAINTLFPCYTGIAVAFCMIAGIVCSVHTVGKAVGVAMDLPDHTVEEDIFEKGIDAEMKACIPTWEEESEEDMKRMEERVEKELSNVR